MPIPSTTTNSARDRVAIAGAGFAGATLARQLAEKGIRVLVFDERNHVAGNCHTERHAGTGVMLHAYGAHIFHTDRREVWDWVNRFGEFWGYTNRVKAVTSRGVFSLPINLLTINQFFQKRFTPPEAQAFLATQGDRSFPEPANFEEQALSMLGRDLYEAFFRGYTLKQWGTDPKNLPASILKRLPVRFNYNDNYYSSRYQGMPLEGYTQIVQRMLAHPLIEVRLREPFSPEAAGEFRHVFFSGPLDSFFGYRLGRLGYRTLEFRHEVASGDFQGNPVMNYCEESVRHTRVIEHKHFVPHEAHEKTVYSVETSRESGPGDTLFYPKRLEPDKALLAG
jgi:UDP-galactopyranose mutase